MYAVRDFSMGDLVTPDPRRVKHFLCELIAFYYFKCERQKELDAVNNEIVSRLSSFTRR